MQFLLTLLNAQARLDLPYDLLGWLGWFLLALLIVIGLWRSWEPAPFTPARKWIFLVILGAMTLFTSLFFGMRLSTENVLPIPGIPVESSAPYWMFFQAVPWMLAAGWIGPWGAVLVGGFNGLLAGIWGTHHTFTILELAAAALIFSQLTRQRYASRSYQILRHPFAAALVLAGFSVPLYFATALFITGGSLAARLDYALTQTWPLIGARNLEILLGGVVAELASLVWRKGWGRQDTLRPSPADTSLQTRFLYSTLPWAGVLFLVMVLTDWWVAGAAAQRMVRQQLESTARVASESLPYFLESGQNLILTLADAELVDLRGEALQNALAQRLRAVPYYRQLYLMDAAGQPLGGYPLNDFGQLGASREELAGIELALNGVLVQTYTIPPWEGESTAQITFLAAVRGEDGTTRGVLLGRTDLNSNPFTQPAIQALETIRSIGGEGVVLDENNRILYHPLSSLVMTAYKGQVSPDGRNFYEDLSAQGDRQYVYYQPMVGRPWAILLAVPASHAQELALSIAFPLLGVLMAVVLLVVFSLRFTLGRVVGSMHQLAQEAGRIAQGQLDHPVQVQGVDEIGRVSRTFEQMRVSLQARLEELNRLLQVSQGVAASLEASHAVTPILKAALRDNACAARVILIREASLDLQSTHPVGVGVGPSAELYARLDEPIFEMARQQDIISVANMQRVRRFALPHGTAQPGALIALALHHEGLYYGALWVAYEAAHTFTEEEIRFLSTLAGQAALAAANARLYATAEIGRQRLEAVLSSTPDPVLVIDEHNCLQLLNPAALQLAGLLVSPTPGKPVKETVVHPDLQDLLSGPVEQRVVSREISLPNGRIYSASVSSVAAEGVPVGRIAILRDITHYKELDTLKTDFVSTVSHDLRSPLTLMRGYATMMQMVGELNAQQKEYVAKIISGVESMSRLVGNLLDLGRIDAGIGLQIEPVTAWGIASHVVEALQPQADNKSIALELERPEGSQVDLLKADKALLEQAVYNLVDNAIKYTPVDGKVSVRLGLRAQTVVFEVTDTGIGIAPLDLPHMFEKFYRSRRREAYQQRGTGLGLAIVRSIAERHHGRVWVESQLGKGSTFYLEVPYVQPEAGKNG
ncbi:HAMP domain-containing histidine kinase [Levilinea saccharolytica]|uniref:histidine kinase n=1 Tax=Levilinea saccharolytica TaxID=229921 RepID=A0A0N8GTE1_9CHLR|nr:HAMP domain-containing histidine kinase [Levilinea saccharolytica]KPL91842.1 hypothetical protein ADN01_00760 [Levilinea saccharolytica]GAP17666.1 protein containing PAS domain S-box [Levilinea saccharolytica]